MSLRIIEPYIWRVVSVHGSIREGAGPIPVLYDGDRVWMEVHLQGEPDHHVIEFRKNGWTIMHPLACRPDLFKCKVNRAAEVQITNVPKKLGRFRCDLTESGQFTVGETEA